MEQIIKEQTCRSQARQAGPSQSISSVQSQPHQVWAQLTPTEQQVILRKIVLICRSLVNRANDRAAEQEVQDEQE